MDVHEFAKEAESFGDIVVVDRHKGKLRKAEKFFAGVGVAGEGAAGWGRRTSRMEGSGGAGLRGNRAKRSLGTRRSEGRSPDEGLAALAA